MASYRFCRTDDLDLLVRAHDACFRVHFPGEPRWSVQDFKRAMREQFLWASSCMVAAEGGDPIGVLWATKRDDAALIWCIGVRADRARQGHARHLLTSLGAKLSILGPQRMVAEIPEGWTQAHPFFEACGFAVEAELCDWVRPAAPPPERGNDLVTPISFDELIAAGALDATPAHCWERSLPVLRRRTAASRGLAVVSASRLEGWLLAEQAPGPELRLLGLGGRAEDTRWPLFADLLVRHAADGRPVRLPRVHGDELPAMRLEAAGFRAEERSALYAATPRPA